LREPSQLYLRLYKFDLTLILSFYIVPIYIRCYFLVVANGGHLIFGVTKMNTLTKIVFIAQLLLFAFLLGRWTYNDCNGYGIFIPSVGGYHVETNNDCGV